MLYRLSYGSDSSGRVGPAEEARFMPYPRCRSKGVSVEVDAVYGCATMRAMIDDVRPPSPTLTAAAKALADERRRRQAEALRANLARRKAQARLRAESDRDGGDDGD